VASVCFHSGFLELNGFNTDLSATTDILKGKMKIAGLPGQMEDKFYSVRAQHPAAPTLVTWGYHHFCTKILAMLS